MSYMPYVGLLILIIAKFFLICPAEIGVCLISRQIRYIESLSTSLSCLGLIWLDFVNNGVSTLMGHFMPTW